MNTTASRSSKNGQRLRFAGKYRNIIFGVNMLLLGSTVAVMAWQHQSHKSVTQRMERYHLRTVTSATAISREMRIIQDALEDYAFEELTPDAPAISEPFLTDHPVVGVALYLSESELRKIVEAQNAFRAAEFDELVPRVERQFRDLNAIVSGGLLQRSEAETAQRHLAGLDLSLEQMNRFHTSKYSELTSALPVQERHRLQILIAVIVGLIAISYAATRRILKFGERAAGALQDSEARYRAVVEDQTELICRFLANNTITFVNEAYCRYFGKSFDELVGQKFMPRIHKEDHAKVQEHFASLGPENLVASHEHRVMMPDGQLRWMAWTNRAVLDVAENIVEFQGTGRDITDRKLAEQASQEKQAQLDNLLSNVDAIFLEGDPCNFYYVGGQVEKILGYPKKMWFEHPGGPVGFWSELLHPDDVDKIDICRQAIERGEDHSFEYRLIARDGRPVWFYDSVMVETSDGKPVKTRSVLIDITDRKQAEEALRTSEQRLDVAVRGTSDGLWDADLNSGKEYWSPRFKELLGYAEHELEATHDQFLAFLHPDDKPRVLEAIRLHVDENRPYDCELRMQTKSGEYRWFQTRGEALRDENGVPYRMAGSIRDISERKRSEEEARKQRDELAHVSRISTMGEMATGIAHELNQPLAAISLYSDAARAIAGRADSDPRELQEILGKLEDQAIRAGDIVRRLRDYVKKTGSVRMPADLNSLVQDVAKFVEPDIRKAEAKLVVQIQEPSPSVLIDEIQIQQVLVNLIRNAVDAMQETPSGQREVIVSTRVLQDGRSEVAVSDAGKGLARDELEQAFSAYFSTKQEGLGMGLPTSRSIVEAHGGKLWAEPNTGPGVTFGFTIPLESGHDQ